MKQVKKDRLNPDLRTFKYVCAGEHIRIEKEKLIEPFPECPACAQLGRVSRFRYLGIHTMTRTDAKKSKFTKKI